MHDLLSNKRIAIWGFGREGVAALTYVRQQFPKQNVHVFCNVQEAEQIAAMSDEFVTTHTEINELCFCEFDVVIKSPGISKYHPNMRLAQAQGTQFIGGTAIWFSTHSDARTICVTGTKGKSTVSSLIAHLLRAAGKKTALVGNIGTPLLETMHWNEQPEFWVIEMSSYQSFEAVRPEVAVMLNFFPEHLDWHGSEQAYFNDKSALITQCKPRVAILNAQAPRVAALANGLQSTVHWFNHTQAWHVRKNFLYYQDSQILDLQNLSIPGQHNAGNVCAALAALDALGLDSVSLAPQVLSFQSLPHRLQRLGEKGGITYVNDSISTTPFASIAALECFKQKPLAILVGGYDRGLDWQVFANYVLKNPPVAIVCMGQNGARIFELLKSSGAETLTQISWAVDLAEAVHVAQNALTGEAIILLSPGAPSFGLYPDYVARGRHFAEIAGFDPNAISKIAGLGI